MSRNSTWQTFKSIIKFKTEQTNAYCNIKERVYGPSISVESLSMGSAATRSGNLMADFNYFLLQIANEIQSIELADMKFLCKGDDTLARGKLERVETARELLNFLKESGKIGPGNVMYLVTLLDRVNLVRLAERAMEEGKKSIFTVFFLSLPRCSR